MVDERQPIGRPADLGRIIDRRPERDEQGNLTGNVVDVTVMDRVVETLRLGGYIEDAAARVGASKKTLYDWMRAGARADRDLYSGKVTVSKLSAHQRRCREFLHAVVNAEADGKMLLLGLSEKLARGGYKRETVTEKRNSAGQVIERTVKEEVAEPDGAMLRWRMERRWPHQFGRRIVELVGGGEHSWEDEADPVEERADALAEQARAYLQGVTDGEGAKR